MRLSNDRVQGRPPIVDRAVKNDDTASLSYYGKKGAEASNKKRAEKREVREYFDEKAADKAALDAQNRLEETNEHIVPIDSEDDREAA
jgi:hypothetical protein